MKRIADQHVGRKSSYLPSTRNRADQQAYSRRPISGPSLSTPKLIFSEPSLTCSPSSVLFLLSLDFFDPQRHFLVWGALLLSSSITLLTFARIECKDPRGRMVAIIDLTVSLSCLGATGSLIQPNPTAAARSQAPTAHSTTTAPPECPAVAAAQQSSSPTQSSGSTERSDGEQAVEPAVPDALIKTSIAGSAVKDIVLTTALRPGSRESGQRRLNGSVPAGDSWTCVYDPRDGSLRDDVPTSAAAPTTCANDATIANVANACYVLSDCATSPRGSQNTPLVKVGDEGQAIAVGGAEPKAPDLGRTVVAGNLEWGVIDLTPKKSAAPRDISLGEEPVSVATAVSLAATALEQDRLPPRPAGSSENDEKVGPSRPQSDGDHTSPVEAVQDRNDGESEAPKEIREAREIIRVKAVTGNDATSRRYPGAFSQQG